MSFLISVIFYTCHFWYVLFFVQWHVLYVSFLISFIFITPFFIIVFQLEIRHGLGRNGLERQWLHLLTKQEDFSSHKFQHKKTFSHSVFELWHAYGGSLKKYVKTKSKLALDSKQISEWHFIALWDPIKNDGGGMKILLWKTIHQS